MSLRFTADVFPSPQNKELFGCIQTTYDIKSQRSKMFEKKKCQKCSCFLVPTENDFLDCPICNTKANYITSPIKIGEGFSKISYYTFIFDVLISKEKIIELIKQLANNLNDNDNVLFIGLGKLITILYFDGSSPTLLNIEKLNKFDPSETYFVNKKQIMSDFIPLLITYYNSSQCVESTTCEIITPLQVSVRQHNLNDEQFGIFVFTQRDVQPMPSEKAHNLGKYVADNLGVVHFGATQSFRRLSAVAKASLGCVFSLNEVVPNTMEKLIKLSQTTRTKIIAPRCVEAIKVTGADGKVRMTSKITQIKLSTTRGFSIRLSADFSRAKSYPEFVPILEFTTNCEGQFLTLTLLRRSKSSEEYVSAMEASTARSIVLKSIAADILRTAWTGIDFEKAVNQVLSKNEAGAAIASDSSLNGLGANSDRDCLRLYYAMLSLSNPLRNIKIEDANGKILSSLPVVYAKPENTDKNFIFDRIETEWPFELRLFSDDAAYNIMLKTVLGNESQ